LYKKKKNQSTYIHKPNYPRQNQSTYTNINPAQPYQPNAKLKFKKHLYLDLVLSSTRTLKNTNPD